LRILVTGVGGMVGQALNQYCEMAGDEVFSYDHRTLDIANADLVKATVVGARPDAVINCAAWTDVDGCELDPARAHAANATGPENLARASRQVGAGFVTISTDYVFDGRKEGFYTQRDDPNPQSVYAQSKLEGERRSQLAYARTIVVRTGFIFGSGGKNFLSTVLDRAHAGGPIKAIANAWGTPTYSRHLAARLRELAQLDIPGVFHVVNAGNGVSYEEFARAALNSGGFHSINVEPVDGDSLSRPAPRPRNSRLRCLLSEAVGLPALPFWEAALQEFAGAYHSAGTAGPR
jgi:dTDP-4-dehydrorhamnose reductase